MNKRLNWIYTLYNRTKERIIIFYNAIYISIKKFNWTKVSLNSSKSYTYTAGDRFLINRIYLSLTDIQEEKKKKAFLVDMKRLDIAVFSKEFFSFVHQFLTRVHITTVWIMTMIVCVSQRQWHQLNSSHAHTWRDGTIQMMANILLHLSPPLSLSSFDKTRRCCCCCAHSLD